MSVSGIIIKSELRNESYLSAISVEKVAEAMGKLIDERLIRGWGLFQVDVIDRAQQVTPLAAIQNSLRLWKRR